jgi:hypothetical protein
MSSTFLFLSTTMRFFFQIIFGGTIGMSLLNHSSSFFSAIFSRTFDARSRCARRFWVGVNPVGQH